MGFDPAVLFFMLGLAAGLAKSDLKLPAALYETLTVFLLLAIGLKGGMELSSQPLWGVLPQCLLVLAMGCVLPLVAFPLLRLRLSVPDAASMAAHYGSVSVVTYAVGQAYLARRGVAHESQTTVFLAILEMPALVVGVLLARLGARHVKDAPALPRVRWGTLFHEVLLGKSMVLLIGGLLIGLASGKEGLETITPFYVGLFKGVLTLFLLELGLVTASQMGILRREGFFLLTVGIGLPLLFSLVGLAVAWVLGLSVGGATLLATLAASASYIAAPAAMRVTVPQANIALSLGAVLGVTFPFNVAIGIPLYYRLAALVAG